MNHKIAFLHTAQVHALTFQRLVDAIDPSMSVRHDVNEALLSDAVAHEMTDTLSERVNAAMEEASDSGAEVVVCTCSTIGGIAEQSLQDESAQAMRIDRAMANLAVANSERILVIAAVESTLKPTMTLLNESSAKAGKAPHLSLQLVEGAWAQFESGAMEGYYDCIAAYIEREHKGYDCVILAQASMAPVAKRFDGSKTCVLASPELGVKAAFEVLG